LCIQRTEAGYKINYSCKEFILLQKVNDFRLLRKGVVWVCHFTTALPFASRILEEL